MVIGLFAVVGFMAGWFLVHGRSKWIALIALLFFTLALQTVVVWTAADLADVTLLPLVLGIVLIVSFVLGQMLHVRLTVS